MSLSSIMSSGADVEPPPKAQQLPPINTEPRRLSKASANPPLFVKQEAMGTPAPTDIPLPSMTALNRGNYENMPPVVSTHPSQQFVAREIPVPDEVEVEAALTRIETSEINDLGGNEFELEKEEFFLQGNKRALDVQHAETNKRKVSPIGIPLVYISSNTRSDDASPPLLASPTFWLLIAIPQSKPTTWNTKAKPGNRSKTRR
jgi:DNA helicase INO80